MGTTAAKAPRCHFHTLNTIVRRFHEWLQPAATSRAASKTGLSNMRLCHGPKGDNGRQHWLQKLNLESWILNLACKRPWLPRPAALCVCLMVWKALSVKEERRASPLVIRANLQEAAAAICGVTTHIHFTNLSKLTLTISFWRTDYFAEGRKNGGSSGKLGRKNTGQVFQTSSVHWWKG